MNRWFRFYDDTINDPKVLKLSDKSYRIWVGLLCAASKNDGVLPPFEDLAILLRIKPEKLQPELEKLIEAKLLDHTDAGIIPHNWNKRQYKSDVSTERVQRFRKRERNVSETPPDTENRIQRTERKKDSRAVAKATRTPDSQEFEEFWKAYPKREGPNPKAEARKVFEALMKRGADPQAIIAAVRRYAIAEKSNIGTRFIPHASTWLRGQRFEDYQTPPATAGPLQAPAGAPSDEELRKKYGQQHHAISTETQAANGHGNGADHMEELRRQSIEIRPGFRAF